MPRTSHRHERGRRVRVTPIPSGPAAGAAARQFLTTYLVNDGLAIDADALWDVANAAPHLKAVFLEATFPEEMADLAEIAMHLTPRLFAAEVAKLRRPADVFAVHIKPRYYEQVVAELHALGLPNLRIA